MACKEGFEPTRKLIGTFGGCLLQPLAYLHIFKNTKSINIFNFVTPLGLGPNSLD